jgi:hypothetical protein
LTTHSLDFYLVKVHEKHQPKNLEPLGSINKKGSLLDLIAATTDRLSKQYTKFLILQQSGTFEELLPDGSFYSGIFRVGPYGVENSIIDIDTSKEAFKKTKKNVDPYPFFFMFCLPPKQSRGLLAVHRVGIGGVKGLLKDVIDSAFDKKFPGYKLCFNRLAPAELMKKIINDSSITEMRVIKHEIPADLADKIGGKKKRYPGTMEYKFVPDDKKLFDRKGLIEIISDPSKLDDLIDLGADLVSVIGIFETRWCVS